MVPDLPVLKAHAAKKEKKKKKADHEVSTETFVLRFFRRMLKEWSNDLAERPEHVKNSPEGKSTCFAAGCAAPLAWLGLAWLPEHS